MDFSPLSAALYERRLAPPCGPVRMVLDTDTYNEVDDQFALAYALRSPERIQLEAVYAAPFFIPSSVDSPAEGMKASVREIHNVYARMGLSPDETVFAGAQNFLTDGPQDSPAVRDLIRRAMASPEDEPLYVVGIAAPTNIASALLLEPSIREKIVVVWMGGHHLQWPTAWEFNLAQDLAASCILFESGVPLVHIPVQPVASELLTTTFELDHYLRGKSEIGTYLCDIVAGYNTDPTFIQVVAESQTGYIQGTSDYPDDLGGPRDYAVERFARSKILFDVAPVAYLVDPTWVRTTQVTAPILREDCTWERAAGRHPMREGNHIRRDFVLGDLFCKLAR